MKKVLLLTISILLSGLVYGQSIKSYVITSAGTSIMSSEGGMYLSVGEPMNTEIDGGDIMISQGFLQVVLSGNSTDTKDLLEEEITVFPNPVNSELILSMPQSDGEYEVRVNGQNGEFIKTQKVSGIENTIDFSEFTQGTYFMNIIKDNKQSETLKILKIK